MKDILKKASDNLFEEIGIRFYEGMTLEDLLYKAVEYEAVKTVKYISNYLDEETLRNVLFELIHLYMKDLDRKKKKKIIKYLTKGGKYVNLRGDKYGMTPLSYAVSARDFDLVRYLVKLGADVNARDSFFGYTPLHDAVTSFPPVDMRIVRYLIQKGADVNAKDKAGYTPLHVALIVFSKNWYDKPSEYLIRHGADILAKNKRGFTPLDIIDESYNIVESKPFYGEDVRRIQEELDCMRDNLTWLIN